MQIVIEIDEDVYKDLTQTGENTIHLGALLDLRKSVRNGKPLPERHGRLIDADEVINNGIDKGFCDWYDEIKNAPTIIGSYPKTECAKS